MYLLLATIEGEILAQLPRVPNGARHRRGLFVMHPARKRDVTQFLPKVLVTKGTRFGGFQQSSYRSSHKSFAGGALA
jgi:hypothetical protein